MYKSGLYILLVGMYYSQIYYTFYTTQNFQDEMTSSELLIDKYIVPNSFK